MGQRKWESKPASLERGQVNAQNFTYHDGAVAISGHIEGATFCLKSPISRACWNLNGE